MPKNPVAKGTRAKETKMASRFRSDDKTMTGPVARTPDAETAEAMSVVPDQARRRDTTVAVQNRLTDEQKRFIVSCLACYRRPSATAAAFFREFDEQITRQKAELYDPTKAAGAKLSPQLQQLFYDTRRRYLTALDDIAIAQQVWRLELLQRGAEHFAGEDKVGSPNFKAAAQLCEQAAKEMGGIYNKKREIEQREIRDPRSVLAAVLGMDPNDLPPSNR